MSNLTDFLFPKATEQQAKDGASNSVLMTPWRTNQYVEYQRGRPLGLAGLDSDGRVPSGQARGVGIGQTFQEVTRVNGTSYTNATGRSIILYISLRTTHTAATASLMVSPDNLSWTTVCMATGTTYRSNLVASVVIPPGHYYQISASSPNHAIDYCLELR